MPRIRQIAVLLLCLVSLTAFGQRRYSADGRSERNLSKAKGFSTRDVDNKTDAFLGLHASLYKGARQYLGFSVDGGWSTFLTNTPVASVTPGGWAAGGKMLYEYHFGLLFLQTGLGAGFQRVTTPVNSNLIDDSWRTFYNGYSNPADGALHPMTDPLDGVHFTMKHVFDGRSDISELWYAQLPVNVGYYIVGTYGIGYLMLGAQVMYAFAGKTIMHATGTSTGTFDVDDGHHYIGIAEEMDNHGFRKDVPITYTSARLPIKLGKAAGLDVLGHLEGGYEFNTFQKIRQYRVKRSDKLDCRLRFAGFVDVSLGSIYPHGAQSMFESEVETGRKGQETLYDFYHPFKTPFVMNHIYSTAVPGNTTWLRSMTVGVRFTVLFSLQAQEHCILCDPWRH